MTRKRLLTIIASVVLIPALALGAYLLYVGISDNFHPITQGEAYRSAQLSGDELAGRIQRHGIKSVLNLRGENPKAQWYLDEIEVCRRLGVQHYDVRLSEALEPADDELAELQRIMREAPRPLLLHCRHGADRSGLVAAMWKLYIDSEPMDSAAKQLSLKFGHVPVGKTTAMDRAFTRWAQGQRQ